MENSRRSVLRITNTPVPPAGIFLAFNFLLVIHRRMVPGYLWRNWAASCTVSMSFTADCSIPYEDSGFVSIAGRGDLFTCIGRNTPWISLERGTHVIVGGVLLLRSIYITMYTTPITIATKRILETSNLSIFTIMLVGSGLGVGNI